MKRTGFNDRFEYNERHMSFIRNEDGDELEFSADEVIWFISKYGLWNGYHRPFNILDINNWLKIIRLVLTHNGLQAPTDFEMGKTIREVIEEEYNNESNNNGMESVDKNGCERSEWLNFIYTKQHDD